MLSRWFISLICLVALHGELLYSSNVQEICDQEIHKENPQIEVIKHNCYEVGKSYDAEAQYDYASWYYLLSGHYQHNIEVIQKGIPQDGNLANVAHSYVLQGDFKNAEKLYRFFIAGHNLLDANQGIEDDYKVLTKIYPQHRIQLREGLKLWRRLYQAFDKNNLEIRNTIRLMNEATTQKNHRYLIEHFEAMRTLLTNYFGEEYRGIATLYDNVGTAYNALGEYDKVLGFTQQGLTLREKILPLHHPELTHSYNNMGIAYQVLENHDKALEYLSKALELAQKNHGESHPVVAQILSAMGRSYGALYRHKKALMYHENAVAIYENTLGAEHLMTSVAYHNLGGYFLNQKAYTQAVHYLEKSLRIREQHSQETANTFTQVYADLGLAYRELGRFDEALKYMKKSLELEKKESIGLAEAYDNLGWLYFSKQNYDEAYNYAKRAFDIFLQERDNYFLFLEASDKAAYLKGNEKYIFLLLESAYLSKKRQKVLYESVNNWLRYKGSLFDSENRLAQLRYQTKDSKIKDKIDRLNEFKRTLAQRYQVKQHSLVLTQTIQELRQSITSITQELNHLFSQEERLNEISYQDIAQGLESNELYIDFARIAENYFVFTIDHEARVSVDFIDVEKTKMIHKSILAFKKEMSRVQKASKENLINLYQLLLAPIVENKLYRDKDALIISPDGLLNLFPFEAMLVEEQQKYLIETKTIRYVPSAKEFLRLQQNKVTQTNTHVVLFSNPEYNANLSQTECSEKRVMSTSFKRMNFMPLPGTKLEAEAIEKILSSYPIVSYQGLNATESNLLKVSQPKILHIATHGFFIKSRLPNPMLKSGLALTGANNAVCQQKSEGVVTALKLSGLNLKGTELVVLSACETGVMGINEVDSISGLSKAFIQGGAKNVVVSLWSVSDMGTKDLMHHFYQEIQNQKEYTNALKDAKIKMIERGEPVFIWAPFIVNGL